MDNSTLCIAPQSVGALDWTVIFQSLIKGGMDYLSAQKEADRQYQAQLAAIQAAKDKANQDAAGGGDKTQMYLLIGGAVVVALLLTMKK